MIGVKLNLEKGEGPASQRRSAFWVMAPRIFGGGRWQWEWVFLSDLRYTGEKELLSHLTVQEVEAQRGLITHPKLWC